MLFLKTGKIFRQGDAAGQNPFNNGKGGETMRVKVRSV